MSDARDPRDASVPAPSPAPPSAAPADNREILYRYFLEHRGRFTPEALQRSAEQAGYPSAEVAEVARLVAADEDSSTTDSGRYTTIARVIVVALYLGTFLLLVVPTRMGAASYGIGPAILGILLFIAGLIALWRVGRRRQVSENAAMALTSMLAVPFVLLVIVAGTCLWATGPSLFGPQ
jgi:hypothetical protein